MRHTCTISDGDVAFENGTAGCFNCSPSVCRTCILLTHLLRLKFTLYTVYNILIRSLFHQEMVAQYYI